MSWIGFGRRTLGPRRRKLNIWIRFVNRLQIQIILTLKVILRQWWRTVKPFSALVSLALLPDPDWFLIHLLSIVAFWLSCNILSLAILRKSLHLFLTEMIVIPSHSESKPRYLDLKIQSVYLLTVLHSTVINIISCNSVLIYSSLSFIDLGWINTSIAFCYQFLLSILKCLRIPFSERFVIWRLIWLFLLILIPSLITSLNVQLQVHKVLRSMAPLFQVIPPELHWVILFELSVMLNSSVKVFLLL